MHINLYIDIQFLLDIKLTIKQGGILYIKLFRGDEAPKLHAHYRNDFMFSQDLVRNNTLDTIHFPRVSIKGILYILRCIPTFNLKQ